MAKSSKQVQVKVATDVEDSEVEALEKKVDDLKKKKLQMKLEADTKKLDETQKKIEGLKVFLDNVGNKNIPINIDDEQIQKAQAELEDLENDVVDLEIKVADGELKAAKELEETLTDTAEVTIDVDDGEVRSASEEIEGLSNKLMGIVGTMGMLDSATKMWEASTQRQSTQFYLGASLGTAKAQEMQSVIQNIVSKVPGDDTFMNMILSGSLAKETSLTTDALSQEATVVADYLAGSVMQGKNALEAQQDLKSYILTGSVAELQSSSILSNQVDLLKDKGTIQERINALLEAEQNEQVAGLSGYDTAANNLEEFMGQIEKSRADLGDFFLPLEQGALKAGIALNENLGGGLTFAIAGLEMAIPTAITGLSGIGEAARGLSALKDGAKWFKELGAVQKIYEAVTSTLIPVQYAEGTAGWFSIGWIAVAILAGIALGLAIVYLYNHSEKFRNAVQWLGDKLKWLAGILVNTITGAVNQFSQIIQGIPKALQNCLDWAYNLVMNNPLVKALQWLGEQAVNAFSILGLGQRSPGKIVKAMRQELIWTQEAIEDSDLAASTAKLGANVSNNFNPNLNTINTARVNGVSGQGGGETIIFNLYGDVDNDDRMRKIVDAVRRELAWNNKTAGRTI